MSKSKSLLFRIIIVVVCLVAGLGTFILYHLNQTVYQTSDWDGTIFDPTISQETRSDLFSDPDNFLKTTAKINVIPLHTGDLQAKLSGAINLNHPAASNLKDDEIIVPVFAYLVHHETFGYFLIDSGYDTAYLDHPFGSMEGILRPLVMINSTLKPEEAIDHQLLHQIGDLNQLNAVFFTHLHLDHTSGLSALPDGLLYIAGEGEKSISIPWLIKPNHFDNSDTIYFLDFTAGDVYPSPIGNAIDIFGDGSFWAISTPGHTIGHVSYLVNTESGPIIISGDAAILNKNFEIGVGPGSYSNDVALAQTTFDRLLLYKQQTPEIRIWSGHDFPE